MLNEVIDTEKEEMDEIDAPKHPMSDFDALKAGFTNSDGNEADNEDDGEIVKDDNAIDYSDITELSEDCPRTPPTREHSTLEDLDDAIPASKVEASSKIMLILAIKRSSKIVKYKYRIRYNQGR